MFASWKMKCLRDIECNIALPSKRCIEKTDTTLLARYSCNNKINCVYFETRLDVAKFFRRHGIINTYSIVGVEVHMWTKTLITLAGNKGQPVQQERLVPFKWEDIETTPAFAITLAALHEFELAGKITGIVIKHLFQAA